MDESADGGCDCRAIRYRMHGTAALRALLPLPLVPARDRLRLRAERADRGRPGRASSPASPTSCRPRATAARASGSPAARSAASRSGATTPAPATRFRFVRVGTLDDPDRFPPEIHIFTASKQPWVILPEGVPAVPEYYDRRRYWPAESLARREAALSRDRA